MKIARDIKENPKILHNFVTRKIKVREKVSPLKNSRGKICCDSRLNGELLENQFESVFVRENLNNIPDIERTMGDISDILINEYIVKNKLSKLKEDKAMSPDGIHLKVLRECAEQLNDLLTKLFKLSLRNGVVSESWRRADVSPIFKKGSLRKVKNYQPVSQTSQLYKVMEFIIRDH